MSNELLQTGRSVKLFALTGGEQHCTVQQPHAAAGTCCVQTINVQLISHFGNYFALLINSHGGPEEGVVPSRF